MSYNEEGDEMFWQKKKQESEPKVIKVTKHNTLTIKMTDKTELQWTVIDWDGVSKTKPWRAFYTWFFGRNGDIFVMRYNTGETAFRRENIVSFTVQTRTEMVDA